MKKHWFETAGVGGGVGVDEFRKYVPLSVIPNGWRAQRLRLKVSSVGVASRGVYALCKHATTEKDRETAV